MLIGFGGVTTVRQCSECDETTPVKAFAAILWNEESRGWCWLGQGPTPRCRLGPYEEPHDVG